MVSQVAWPQRRLTKGQKGSPKGQRGWAKGAFSFPGLFYQFFKENVKL